MIIAKSDDTTPFESDEEMKETVDEIGEKVKIKSIKKERMDPEDYYYLKKFENRTGTILEQNKSKSGKFTYKIDFGQNLFGYFYHEDFILISEDKRI